MQPLVIKEWKADETPVDGDGNYVRIAGRQPGFIAWLLARLKIDATTTIKISDCRVEFSSASLAGIDHRMIPLSGVCSTRYGYHKPLFKTIAVFLSLFGPGVAIGFTASTMLFIFITLAALVIAFLYYYFNRTLTLGFVEMSGHVCAIAFKPSFIEGVSVDEKQAAYICKITQAIIEQRGK